MLYYTKTVEQTLKELGVSDKGLTAASADKRLKQYGPNAIKVVGEPLWRKLIEPFANVFMLVLAIAVVISLLHGDELDAIIIGVIMTISAGIYYVQRFSTERILRSLSKHTAQKVRVLRGGETIEVDASLLVPGDVITLNEGEKVPADTRLLNASSLRVDESQLTGESVPIDKQIGALKGEKPIYEQSNLLFQGSFVVSGEATAVVFATGNKTEFGQIASLTSHTNLQSPVQKKIDRLLSQIIAVIAGIAVVAFALSMYRGVELAESLRFVIALSVSAVPEDMPIAISVILILGMRRMAAKRALVRTMSSIETIGVINTIATDKTGTLTKNQLTVQDIWQPQHASSDILKILDRSVNRSAAKMFDPLDTALHNYALNQNVTASRHTPAVLFPFDQATAMSGNLWHRGADYDLYVKGAPEHVLARSSLTEGEREEATHMLQQMTAKGYRVIAIAHTTLKRPIDTFADLKKADELEFDGFVAIADVLRPEAKHAIQQAQKAGVTVRMITGDHFETAYHIGRQLGMVKTRDQVFDCRKMSTMSDKELEEIIDKVRVFSRVIPEHKFRILSLLKKHNITAMTGDGVNDVPALANAHVGIAMGSGASIAKDAGDIILMDDNFKSIVDAMREGRTIFANISRMLLYLLSTNAGEVLTMLGALVIGMPIPLVPVQILWVNLVTDTAMVIPLGLEPGEESNMRQKPRLPNAPILGKYMISRMLLIAVVIAIVVLTLYVIFSNLYGHEYGRTIAFSALVVMQWANAFSLRSDYQSLFSRLAVFNGKFYIGLSLSALLHLLALFGPLGPLLHITPVAVGDLFITGLIAFIIPIIVVELHKYIGRRYFHPTS